MYNCVVCNSNKNLVSMKRARYKNGCEHLYCIPCLIKFNVKYPDKRILCCICKVPLTHLIMDNAYSTCEFCGIEYMLMDQFQPEFNCRKCKKGTKEYHIEGDSEEEEN